MKTIKPITTITYNTPAYLELKLHELLDAELIDFYFWIFHYGETDELGKKEKDHIHLYMRPACSLEMNHVPKYFVELDPTHPKNPLTCMPCRKCNSDFDAFYYFLHDPDYLLSKGMTRQYHYALEELKTNNDDFLTEMRHTFPVTPFQKERKVRELIAQHATDADILQSGIYTFAEFGRSYSAIHALRDGFTIVRLSPSPIEKEEVLAPVPEWHHEPCPFDVDEDGQLIIPDPPTKG